MTDEERARVESNVRAAETRDLLDRATAFRQGMEPSALEVIEVELARRGYDREMIQNYAAEDGDALLRRPEGFA